ncbi:4-hydroxybenzoate-octaprenyltransferase [Legionella birminghamensis]|uniref:4-hydroxybenzoate octaprenyltransferase n=1 Tax=Legionella birminghamensis TaxID=28083 RepID=A0A378I9W5_9GAMM|nr:4-hydroxybenzoate octaprenyltransferase [Legionella birminghamensis]KTC69288.1 4-hydroxybenzoate-octaprenyltransferase [Legionella birminghamensis]STX31550.1 4-hydroxybenzoate-octaprenyltransferase [Legionella birminghamensis]
MNWNAYYRLGRFDKPVGILLLWSPSAWGLWFANQGHPPLILFLQFLAGTILMRAAGCVINDIADRNIDCHVRRTRHRPLTAGEIPLKKALIYLFLLLFAALMILIQLPLACTYYALFALLITIIYPFCKRFMQAPQVVLGIAFSMGIPMAYAASEVPLDKTAIGLLLINFLWTLAYDTEYAMADREDDLKIGVKSTAVLFADYDRLIIALLQGLFHTCWLYLIISAGFYNRVLLLCWLAAGSNLIYQQYLIADRAPNACFKAFIINSWYGLILWLGMVLSF